MYSCLLGHLSEETTVHNSETLNEIKQMPRIKFKNLIKIRIERNALEYLQNKRGSKGKEIEFTSLEMSEYLLPYNSIMRKKTDVCIKK